MGDALVAFAREAKRCNIASLWVSDRCRGGLIATRPEVVTQRWARRMPGEEMRHER